MSNATTTLAGIIRPREHDLIDPAPAAELLGVTEGTLSVWRSTGRYNLPFVKIGRKVRYSRTALQTWLESRTHANGATR